MTSQRQIFEFARMAIVSSEIHWTNLARVVSDSILMRLAPDGTQQVRAYSGTVRVSNGSGSIELFSIEWSHSGQRPSVERVLQDESSCNSFEADDLGVRLSVELAPNSSQIFSLVHRTSHASSEGLGFRRNGRAFVRRRLSEVRDNYLSNYPHLLAVVKHLQRRI
jgi:hypothetical protein